MHPDFQSISLSCFLESQLLLGRAVESAPRSIITWLVSSASLLFNFCAVYLDGSQNATAPSFLTVKEN